MKDFSNINQTALYNQINEKGYGLISSVLTPAQCQNLILNYTKNSLFRKTVVMERHSYGKGQYRYYQHPLPELIQKLRTDIYQLLGPLANQWAKALRQPMLYPEIHAEFLQQCAAKGQEKATPLILQYKAGGFNTLHQDLYGEIYFPMQAIFCLSQPEKDFTGGSLVLTEQKPRAQSRAMVINPKLGDMIIIPTQFRPAKSVRGYYRLNMRHGVSEVLSGERYTMGVILHDALK
ncbi:MAG: 2OG-Fe(II) oxygenase [Roseivirga sp.]|nr:2OG-Fe(II) oxygenase [Roseivirga sp.]